MDSLLQQLLHFTANDLLLIGAVVTGLLLFNRRRNRSVKEFEANRARRRA